ncbi:diguanylate cyclase domain-containing protein [Caenimonas terrae]|uniref:Diguanylate cyclase domain-containing protein n=1 Tax=Caenimonas terrae TaxID=696074 RepID=A0ABW0NFQ0_9BURK
MNEHADPLVALSLLAGAQVMVVCFSVVMANAYRERGLLLHAGATMLGVIAAAVLDAGRTALAQTALLLLLAFAGLQVRDLVSHAGAVRNPRRWMTVLCMGVLPAAALATAALGYNVLLPGAAAWTAITMLLLLRAWPQSQPWIVWLAASCSALAAGVAWLGWRSLDNVPDPALPLAACLTAWAALTHLTAIWRSRILSETRVRMDARNMVDPLTGLAAPLVFYERVHAVRNLMRRYGHPSVLLLVHIENLHQLYSQFGPEVAESAVLVAANRIRQSVVEGDVAARLSHSRIGVLCEGVGLAEGAANFASRILVAGLKEPLPAAPTEFLQFRIVMALVPVTDVAPKTLLQKMSDGLDAQVREAGERRIVSLGDAELA